MGSTWDFFFFNTPVAHCLGIRWPNPNSRHRQEEKPLPLQNHGGEEEGKFLGFLNTSFLGTFIIINI